LHVSPCTHNATLSSYLLFFFNVPAPPDIYPLSLHDALPISITSPDGARISSPPARFLQWKATLNASGGRSPELESVEAAYLPKKDRKSTRLNSSHRTISYAVFCLKKKKKKNKQSKPTTQ